MNDAEYVLCKRSNRDALFACGPDPGHPSFLKDVSGARRFPSVSAALAYRASLPSQEAPECGVFQLLPDGRLVPPESAEPAWAWGHNGGATRYPSSGVPRGGR